ncbi:HAD family hydrolase [Magnetovibrio sp. PR-2]|uniref:D-glycero-alpha-D-manno-heptose-1,7-bisphosphate 7-phosphatase n=1 Tax=Magnetovibrio sp. PR-2 TaxID=3120356 RepID=UPI002FCE144E
MPLKRAIFLDRDGVLNRTDVRDAKPYAPTRVEDFDILPDVAEALSSFKRAGFFLVVVTNQPDVGNGKVERETVEAMHQSLMRDLPIDALKVCYHKQSEGCPCRKPEPGMLLDAAEEYGIDVPNSFMIGDRAGDVLAGKSAGCRTVFIDLGYRSSEQTTQADIITNSLPEAADRILALLTQEAPKNLRVGAVEIREVP